VHKSNKDQLIKQLIVEINSFYGDDPFHSEDYPRIIREKHLEDLIEMLTGENVIVGGNYHKETCYLAPTLLDEPSRESTVMNAEIFGPILPIIEYSDRANIEAWVDSFEKPLGGYCFTENKEMARWFIHSFSFGGGVINDSIVQFVNERLPFGGVGNSGIGAYHGKKTFDVFSHHKSIVHRRTWLDLTVKYPPYKGKMQTIKKLLKFV
jgi:aldehyde dehydrogenase (NAD+)